MEVDEADEADEAEEEVTEASVLVGLPEEGKEQEEIVLQRFESRRIGKLEAIRSVSSIVTVQLTRVFWRASDSYIPRKPGHLLNAGGPVTGLAWCPRRCGLHKGKHGFYSNQDSFTHG